MPLKASAQTLTCYLHGHKQKGLEIQEHLPFPVSGEIQETWLLHEEQTLSFSFSVSEDPPFPQMSQILLHSD